MSAYMDPVAGHGWRLRGRLVRSCHLIADTLEELHAVAAAAGLRKEWFQKPPKASVPHYDLTESRREAAIAAGAIALERREFVAQLQRIRREMKAQKVGGT
jgi:hypothetical protein